MKSASIYVLSALVTLWPVISSSRAYSDAPVTDEKLSKESFMLPVSEANLPGEGALRRYPGYVKGWQNRRFQWAHERQQDQNAVVFLGDSITQGWKDTLAHHFDGMKVANRGISGDTTRGMLIRLQEDVLTLQPSAIVILAGTNDIEVGIDVDAIVRNLMKIIHAVKQHDVKHGCRTPIIMCRVFPSAAAKKRPADVILRLNQHIEDQVRGDAQVILLDTWSLFADPTGDALAEYFPDFLHLNAAGYTKWASALRPLLATLGLLETEADAFKPEEGFVSLFNGHDLTGWGFRPTSSPKKPASKKPGSPVRPIVTHAEDFAGKAMSSDGRYRAINGRLVVTTPPEGRRIQQLWTTKEYGDDFVLRLQFRATPNADSGVFIRQPQLQCRDYILAGPWQELSHYRPQDWNDLEVIVSSGNATATCNGEKIPAMLKVPQSGPIGLEGDRGQMEYRRIRLKSLARSDHGVSERPNILFFIADDVSWNDIGCYQQENRYAGLVARTPHIDQLAGDGRRFDNAILTASSCSPSRSSIITGRYPHNCGRASELHQPIAAHLPWFPRLLKDAGYYTALVGKHHMSSDGAEDGNASQPPAFDFVSRGVEPGNRGGHAEWVQTVKNRPMDQPFFFWFASLDAHRAWDGDKDWVEEEYGPRHKQGDGVVPPFLVDNEATRSDLASYRNEVTRFDHFIGKVIGELRRQKILENTLIIVMADNGRPFPRAKTRLHDSGMKTPLVVHWPERLQQPGTPTKSLVSAIDIAPTVLRAAGVNVPPTMQGVSFLPTITSPTAVVRTVAFSEHNWHDYEAHGRSVRTDDGWLYIKNNRPKLPWQGPADSVRSPSHSALLKAREGSTALSAAQADVFVAPRPVEELYFTPKDPLQLHNLARQEPYEASLQRMQRLLARWSEETLDSVPDNLSRDEFHRETGERLKMDKQTKNWFRGTPAGWDRKASQALGHGPIVE